MRFRRRRFGRRRFSGRRGFSRRGRAGGRFGRLRIGHRM